MIIALTLIHDKNHASCVSDATGNQRKDGRENNCADKEPIAVGVQRSQDQYRCGN